MLESKRGRENVRLATSHLRCLMSSRFVSFLWTFSQFFGSDLSRCFLSGVLSVELVSLFHTHIIYTLLVSVHSPFC